MAEPRTERRSIRVAPLIGVVICLATIWLALKGFQWYECLIMFCVGIMVIYGRRRVILRVGVRRSGDKIVCRYLPLYEGYTYFCGILLPAFGVGALGAGVAERNLPFLIGGIVLLIISVVTAVFAVLMWRRCRLCITVSTLRVRAAVVGARARALTEIRRDVVQAIEPRRVVNAVGFQVEITYRGAGGATETVRLGPQAPQLSVQPIDLLNGLKVWKDGAGEAPDELLDRIERILCGGSTAAGTCDARPQ